MDRVFDIKLFIDIDIPELYSEFVDYYFLLISTLEKNRIIYPKYKKTLKRYNETFDNLTWNSFTKEYQIFLSYKCLGKKEVNLYKINDLCTSLLSCDLRKQIKKSLSSCRQMA